MKKLMQTKRIALGCMGMNRGNKAQSIRTIDTAIANGVTLLNTGEFYCNGESEMVVGEALSHHNRDDYFISVKFGALPSARGLYGLDMNPFNIRAHLTYSLTRLGLDYVDLYQPCRMDQIYPVEDVVGEISRLVDEGLVRNIGLTETDPETLRRANAVHPIYMFEKSYSLINRSIETDGDLDMCRKLGIPFLAYGLLAHGLLTDRTLEKGLPTSGVGAFIYRPEDADNNIAIVKEFKKIADEVGCSMSNLAIAWALQKNPDMLALIGTTSSDHLLDALRALEVGISGEQMSRIENLFSSEKIRGGKLLKITYIDGRVAKME